MNNMDITLLILIETLKRFPELNWMDTVEEIAKLRGVSSEDLIRAFSDWKQGQYVIQSK